MTALACFAASMMASSVTLGAPKIIFSLMLVAKRTGS